MCDLLIAIPTTARQFLYEDFWKYFQLWKELIRAVIEIATLINSRSDDKLFRAILIDILHIRRSNIVPACACRLCQNPTDRQRRTLDPGRYRETDLDEPIHRLRACRSTQLDSTTVRLFLA